MPSAPTALPPTQDDRERLYRELRAPVLTLLRTRYSGLDDHEEVYQEAWTELLEYEASGHVVHDTRALLKTIAERRARDRVRNYRPAIIDPEDAAFVETVDGDPLPDEQAQVRLDAARIRQVIDSLDERAAEALKLRYDLLLDASEISRRMHVTPKHLEKVMTNAYRHVAEALAIGSDGESAWSRRQRSLLVACEVGVASARQRRQAEHMLATDPQSRVMLAELRVALRDVAAALPLPVLAEEDRVRRRLEWAVDLIDRTLPGGRRTARQLVDGASSTGAAEPITFGAGAVGAGAAAKVALACLAAGGTIAVCLPSKSEPQRKTPTAPQAAPAARALRAEPAVDQIRPAAFTSTPRVGRRPHRPHAARWTPHCSPARRRRFIHRRGRADHLRRRRGRRGRGRQSGPGVPGGRRDHRRLPAIEV